MTPLRQRMLEDMQIRNLASSTQRAYVEHVARFARHFGQSPAVLGPKEIRAYQLYLTNDQHLAPATIGSAVAARRRLTRREGTETRPGAAGSGPDTGGRRRRRRRTPS
jgi:hypothetical protein